MIEIEKTILASYMLSEAYNRTVTAHLKPDYFEDEAAKIIIKNAIEYTIAHQKAPTKLALKTIVEGQSGLPEAIFQQTNILIEDIFSDSTVADVKNTKHDFLLTTTETWCKERSVFNTIILSMDILEGKAKEGGKLLDKAAIPDLMQKALAISFDTTIGHNYLVDAPARYDYMHSPIAKFKFHSQTLNKITGGGIERGTLNLLLCPPHGGKSLTMASFAADYLRDGLNVLVITLEMAEMKIGERLDANLLNVPIDQLKNVPKQVYLKKFEDFQKQGHGKLIVKQYPTSSAGASHFRFLLQELEIKQGFVPDIVVVDYMGICTSARYKTTENMYQVQKAVGEELRGLAVERNFGMWSAIQTNKSGIGAADFDMTSISESIGHAMTADLILALITTDELVQLNQVRFKQLKNRYGSIHELESFLQNMDRKKMMVYEDDGWKTKNQNTFPDEPAPNAPDDDMMDFSNSFSKKQSFNGIVV